MRTLHTLYKSTILYFFREHNPDVIIGTESWLSTDINDTEIFPQDYVVYRKDRSERLGGGVFIAIRDTIVSYKEDWNCNGLCEAVWCRIVDKYNTHYLLGCFYDPPSDCSSALSEFLSVLERQAHINNSRIVVGGDFNLPYIDWEHMVSLTSGRYQKKNQILLNVLNNCGLEQLVKVPTRLSQNVGNILDLVVTNTPQRIQSIITCDGISDHSAIIMQMENISRRTKVKQIVKLFSLADIMELNNVLYQHYLDFCRMAGSRTVNENWCHFKESMQNVDSLVPVRTINVNADPPGTYIQSQY